MTLGSGTLTGADIRKELGIASNATFVVPTNLRKLANMLTPANWSSGSIVLPTSINSKSGLSMHAAGPGEFEGSNASTIEIQSNAQVGDIAVLYDCALSSNGTPPPQSTPSGWTDIGGTTGSNENGLGIRSRIAYRILTSGQPGSTITGMNGAERNRKVMCIIRTALPIASVTPVGWVHRVGGGAPSNIALSSSGGAPNMAVIGFGAAQNTPTFSLVGAGTNSLQATNGASVTRCAVVGYTKNNTPNNITVSMNDSGDTNCISAGWFEFTFTV